MSPFRSRTIHSREELPGLRHSLLLQTHRSTMPNASECTARAAPFLFRSLLESGSGHRLPAPSALLPNRNHRRGAAKDNLFRRQPTCYRSYSAACVIGNSHLDPFAISGGDFPSCALLHTGNQTRTLHPRKEKDKRPSLFPL